MTSQLAVSWQLCISRLKQRARLVVRPSMRGKGIGKALATACVQRARESGAHCIGLHTSPIMTVALPMYRRMGFVEDGEMPPIAGAPYARYLLRFGAWRPASTCQY